ncbi:myosin-IIIb isoform X3 [Chiloscyllium punctatum]|uniref:myosin-IIIb isoform X3 n=1 Tax=Chiloscyllium punctatum TaxID=137246 RepID=UPI003B63E16F
MAGCRMPEDLATLSELDESVLLEVLSTRFRHDHVYTYVGDILIAINPLKYLPLYEKSEAEKYKSCSKSNLPPHIFAVADRAYQSMLGRLATGPKNQCIVISGESGAGKTESTKLLLRQIMELCKGNSQLERQILQVNPLLEAFGNAQTVMNDNSSRFGKYIQLRFRNTAVKGAKINEYLLEKSRVVHQDEGERNFHIFYYMFAGISAADQEVYGLLDPTFYRYLNHKYGAVETIKQWSKKYNEVCNALDMVGFLEQEQVDMMTILAGILSLGNIIYEPQENGILKVTDQSKGWLKAAAGQFGVEEEELLKCLICTMAVTRGESIQRYHSKQQAEDARDSIAKVAYGRVFGWIVSKVNQLLAPKEDVCTTELQEIGILDIFGFENFAVNRYEQMCINLANEQLQYFFNHHIFIMQQKEYKEEGLEWETITYKDNKSILDLFLARPLGVFSLLDEQSAFPQATDKTFVDKLNSSFKGNPHFKIDRSRTPGFTVIHYAGKIQYNASGFLEKNRDTIPASIRGLFINSITPLLSVLFAATVSRTGTLMAQQRPKKTEDNFNSTRKQSVGAQFRHSLAVLMEKMFAANPHFIRCVKPNINKLPDHLDSKLFMDQLRYNGLLETIRIRKDGYSWRPFFKEFAERYGILLITPNISLTKERSLSQTVAEDKKNCLAILQTTGLKDWKSGKSRLFFKYWHQDELAKCIEKLEKAAIIIQKSYKRFHCQSKYKILLAELQNQRQLELERQIEERRQMELEQEMERKKQEMEWKNERTATPPIPLPRKKKPLPRPRSVAVDKFRNAVQPPVPRPRSKLVEATPFDNSRDHMNSSWSQEQADKEHQINQKRATIRWFKETQARKVIQNGTFPCWFHGMITRRESEDLLANQPLGCFLIRVSGSREGYTLTFRGIDRCRHYMIEMQPNGRYVILGEDKAHPSLPDLVDYYKTVGIQPFMEVLTTPCGQKCAHETDYEELRNLSVKTNPQEKLSSGTAADGSTHDRVHNELSKLFVPPDLPLSLQPEMSPVIRKIRDRKLQAASSGGSAAINSENGIEDEHQGGKRTFPRLYPSIRLAMREIQQVHEQQPTLHGPNSGEEFVPELPPKQFKEHHRTQLPGSEHYNKK